MDLTPVKQTISKLLPNKVNDISVFRIFALFTTYFSICNVSQHVPFKHIFKIKHRHFDISVVSAFSLTLYPKLIMCSRKKSS